jgi:hypothetical protein
MRHAQGIPKKIENPALPISREMIERSSSGDPCDLLSLRSVWIPTTINREKYITRRTPLVALGDKADSSSPSRDSITRTRSAVNAIFPRDGNLAIDANDRSTEKGRKEFKGRARGQAERESRARVVNNSRERDRRRSLNHPFKP